MPISGRGARLSPNHLLRYATMGPRQRVLIAPGFLSPLLPLSRSQLSMRSTVLDADGERWREFGADEARFEGPSRALRAERQGTNLVANIRTPAGTGWTNTGVTPTTITGPDGVAGSAVQLNEGAATGTHTTAHGVTSYTSGLLYPQSALVRAGTCSSVQLVFSSASHGLDAWANFDLTGAGAVGTFGLAVTRTMIRALGGGWFWCEMVAPATATASANAALVFMTTGPTAARAQSYAGTNRTLDLFWVWTEQAAIASTPALPPVGSPAAATRGRDNVEGLLTAAGLGPNGAGTILFRGSLDALSIGAGQALFEVCDGTTSNGFRLTADAASSNLLLARTTGGAEATASLGTLTAGADLRGGITGDGAGRLFGALNTSPGAAVTGGPTSGLNQFRVWSRAGGVEQSQGRILDVITLPRPLSDAELAARVAAL